MSCKVNTKGSLCSNTAAGCISRHQLVPFHSRPESKSTAGFEMYRATLKVSVLLVSDCWLIYWRPAVLFSSEQMQKIKNKIRGRAHPILEEGKKALGCWAVHISRQDPRRGKSHHPKRSCWEATAKWALEQDFARRATHSRLQHCLRTQKHCRHGEEEDPNSLECNIAVTLLLTGQLEYNRFEWLSPILYSFFSNQFALINEVASTILKGFFPQCCTTLHDYV